MVASFLILNNKKLTLALGHVDCKELKDLLNKDNATPVAAFGNGKEPSSSAAAAKTTTIAMDANLMVSTGHDEFQKKVEESFEQAGRNGNGGGNGIKKEPAGFRSNTFLDELATMLSSGSF